MASDESGIPGWVFVAILLLLVLAVVVVIGGYCLWYPACLAPMRNASSLNASPTSTHTLVDVWSDDPSNGGSWNDTGINGSVITSEERRALYGFPVYPNPKLTPGDVLTTDTRIICVPGYSASVRDVSDSEKQQVYLEYGILTHKTGEFEIDHFLPLCLGGSNNLLNLWAEKYNISLGAKEKDKVENYLHREVCGGRMSIEDAQERIRSDWVAVYEGVYTWGGRQAIYLSVLLPHYVLIGHAALLHLF